MKDKLIYIALAMAITAVVMSSYAVECKNNNTSEKDEVPAYGSDRFIQTFENKGWEVPADFEPIDCELDEDVQEYTYYLCKQYNIDFGFVMGLIKTESDFQPHKISNNSNNTQDYGLMQINSCNHDRITQELGVTDFLDPYQNINAGMYILYLLFEKYDGEPDLVLMAYNLGEYGASILWEQEIYETRYTKEVNANIAELQEGAQ